MAQMQFVRPEQSMAEDTTIIMQVPALAQSKLDWRQLKTLLVISTIQLICGILLAIFEAINISRSNSVGAGFGSGAFLVSAGAVGIAGAALNRNRLLIATLALSILSSLTCFAVVALTGSTMADCYYWYSYGGGKGCRGSEYVAGGFLVITALVALAASVWVSVLCGKGLHGNQGTCCTCTIKTAYYAWQPSGDSQAVMPPPTNVAGQQHHAPVVVPLYTQQTVYQGATQPAAMSRTNNS